MKSNLFLVTILLLLNSCSDGTKKKSIQVQDDTRIEGKYPNDINSLVTAVDTTLNPFANGLLIKGSNCEGEYETERINCVISKLPPRPLPMHFGPLPDISRNVIHLDDSLFIVKALKDSIYFNEEERQYSYGLGVNIPHEYDFSLVVITELFSVGKSYILLTISNSGEYVDKLVIGSESSDYESIFGRIESLDDIEVITKKIGYDQEKDLLYFSSSVTEHYYINEKGRILKK